MAKKITYAETGVSYDAMDPFKLLAQKAAGETAANIDRFGLHEVASSRGESAYLIEADGHYIAHVEEGLGTKNMVADAMHEIAGKHYYDKVAQDAVGAIVNDMITLGALPLSVAMHLAAGTSNWFLDEGRVKSLVEGWKQACNLSRCVWGGGETPTLKGVIHDETVAISGSAVGIIQPKSRYIQGNIQDGDAIVMCASSGIHTNGLTLARKIADETGYDAKLSDGRMYGEALLDPTTIYVPVIEDCQEAGIDLHYAVHVTGHGWRKLMRAVEPFVYTIEKIPPVQPVFEFIQQHGPVDDSEAYGNFNMGAGFALYVAQDQVEQVIEVAHKHDIEAWNAGTITKEGDAKRVVIKPKNIVFEGASLAVR